MPEDQAERYARWARELSEGRTVVFRQRRGPALGLLLGALVLVLLVVVLLAVPSGADPVQALCSPDLGLVLLVVGVWFVPPLTYRLVTGRPRLEVGPEGLRYGRFRTDWSRVGAVRLYQSTLVEVTAKYAAQRCFLLDNRATTAVLRRGFGARGSWLSQWLDVPPSELAQWVEDERRRRQGLRPRSR